ncbi:MAG: hypothetical protein WCH52_08870 [Bacteroidota bacterium]
MKKIILGSLIMATIFSSCKKNSDTPAAPSLGVTGLNCTSATFSAAATIGVSYNGTATVPYTGGNAIAYPAGSAISSTGVTGLSATLTAGTLATGNGNLSYTVSGTPSAAGNAIFAITFGGQSCSLTLNVLQPFMNASSNEKWYVDNEIDTAFCCVSTFPNLTAVPDSNFTYPGGTIPNADFMQFLPSGNSYKWFFYDPNTPTTYSGSYTYGYSTISAADTITTTFAYNGSPLTLKYRINNITPTTMQLRNRGYYYGSPYNGDTLVYRWTYNMIRQ